MFDYLGIDWNAGFKVVMVCCGFKFCELVMELFIGISFFSGFKNFKVVLLGVVGIEGLVFSGVESY